jgi:hypothetical protein
LIALSRRFAQKNEALRDLSHNINERGTGINLVQDLIIDAVADIDFSDMNIELEYDSTELEQTFVDHLGSLDENISEYVNELSNEHDELSAEHEAIFEQLEEIEEGQQEIQSEIQNVWEDTQYIRNEFGDEIVTELEQTIENTIEDETISEDQYVALISQAFEEGDIDLGTDIDEVRSEIDQALEDYDFPVGDSLRQEQVYNAVINAFEEGAPLTEENLRTVLQEELENFEADVDVDYDEVENRIETTVTRELNNYEVASVDDIPDNIATKDDIPDDFATVSEIRNVVQEELEQYDLDDGSDNGGITRRDLLKYGGLIAGGALLAELGLDYLSNQPHTGDNQTPGNGNGGGQVDGLRTGEWYDWEAADDCLSNQQEDVLYENLVEDGEYNSLDELEYTFTEDGSDYDIRFRDGSGEVIEAKYDDQDLTCEVK